MKEIKKHNDVLESYRSLTKETMREQERLEAIKKGIEKGTHSTMDLLAQTEKLKKLEDRLDRLYTGTYTTEIDMRAPHSLDVVRKEMEKLDEQRIRAQST